MTQNEQIFEHLKTYGKITALDAVYKYNIFRLSARIYDLRHKYGYEIKSRIIIKNGKPYAEYYLTNERGAA